MESATILTPLALALAVFCFPPEPHILGGAEYEKNIIIIPMHGEKFYQLSGPLGTKNRSRANCVLIYVTFIKTFNGV